jgi:hypothetical protein
MAGFGVCETCQEPIDAYSRDSLEVTRDGDAFRRFIPGPRRAEPCGHLATRQEHP